jgi:hypothetical protein
MLAKMTANAGWIHPLMRAAMHPITMNGHSGALYPMMRLMGAGSMSSSSSSFWKNRLIE